MLIMSVSGHSKQCVTVIKVNKFIHTWTIKNFKFLYPEAAGRTIMSLPFTNGVNNENEWQIWIYPDGYDSNHMNYVGLHLNLNNTPPVQKAHLIVSLVDKKEKENVHAETHFKIQRGSYEHRTFIQLVSKDDIYDEGKGLLPNGNLTIKCTMYIQDGITHSDDEVASKIQTIDKEIRDDFERLLDDENFGDVKLVVGKKEFFVYKGMLAARSPVFAAMFQHNMRDRSLTLIHKLC